MAPVDHVAITHQPFTALEQWKASRHRPLWVAVINCNVDKRDVPQMMHKNGIFLLV